MIEYLLFINKCMIKQRLQRLRNTSEKGLFNNTCLELIDLKGLVIKDDDSHMYSSSQRYNSMQ
jgi:hypothetical protein